MSPVCILSSVNVLSWLFNSIRKKYPESEFVMYDGATHCWDCRQLNGYSKKTYYGVQMYRFDEEVTTNSQNVVVTFLKKLISMPNTTVSIEAEKPGFFW